VGSLERSRADNRRTRTAGGTYKHKLSADDHNNNMAAIGQFVVVISGFFPGIGVDAESFFAMASKAARGLDWRIMTSRLVGYKLPALSLPAMLISNKAI
jgi:hypothetical protein